MKLAAGSAAVVALALGAPHAQQSVFRARTDVVEIDAAVKDGSRPVTSLTRDDFVLRDRGVVQTILDFERERRPLDVTLTIDVSSSMFGERREAVARAIARIGAALEAADRAAVVTFGTHVTEVAPLGSPPVIVDLKPGAGLTSVFDAVLLSLATAPSPGRRQLNVLMTDAADTASEFDSPIVRRTAGYASGQLSFVITRPTWAFGFGRRWGDVMGTLRAVADTTGGQLVQLERHEQLGDAFLAALDDFRTSYVLRYRPTGVEPAGWHDVTVAVKGRNYSVRARRGYWGFP